MKKSVNRSTPAVSQTKGHAKQQHPLDIALDEAETAALGLTRAFGCHSVGIVPPIDAVIMGRLRAALASIDDDLEDACFQRGILPQNMAESLRMARFLCITLPYARASQNATGVPASILIAEAYQISGPSFYGCTFELDRPDSNDIFDTRQNFTSMGEAFSARAHWLKQQPAFQTIMRATGDARIGLTSPAYPSNFLALIAAWSKKKYGVELVATISQHNLLECDRMKPVV